MILGYRNPQGFTFTCLGIDVQFTTTTNPAYMSYEGYRIIGKS